MAWYYKSMANTLLPKHLEERFTRRAKNAIYAARALRTPNNDTQDVSRFLYTLSQEHGSLAKNILETHKITSEYIINRLASPKPRAKAGLASPKSASRRTKGDLSAFQSRRRASRKSDKGLRAVVKKAMWVAAKQHQPYVGTEHLLYAVMCRMRPSPTFLTTGRIRDIKKHLDTIFAQSVYFPHVFKNWKSYIDLGFFESGAKAPRASKRKSISHRERSAVPKNPRKQSSPHVHVAQHSRTPALDAFCDNLTLRAEQRELDPVIGRENEINRIVHILSRRTKNNPLLIGEPGVGKTAIVQGLAQRIANGEVPGNLLHKHIYSLNLNLLIAGTMFRGDFEARIRDVLEESSKPDTIIFIDEIHTVIGAGAAQGSLDVANILKPALSGGSLRCIGATTFEEYRKYIEKDRALERRFQIVTIEEETEEQSIQTLSNLKKLYESHHDITIEDEAIESAVLLSSRYIRDRFLPDKALDVLDEAASRLKSSVAITERTKRIRTLEREKLTLEKEKERAIVQEHYQEAITLKYRGEALQEEIRRYKKKFPLFSGKPSLARHNIEETIAEMSGVPIQKTEDEAQKLKKIRAHLNREIKGQQDAVTAVVDTLTRNRAGIQNPLKPLGSFLFTGPGGVGKTALAKALAEAHTHTLVKLDMSEYAEPYTISRLIGSPPGYVGYGEGGELTEKIRRDPYAVVLFDEIEKAHPAVHNLLLSLLEEGTLQDATGRSVSFRNAIIVLTSNTESSEGSAHRLGFSSAPETSYGLPQDSLRDMLSPELLSRIDRVVVFKKLQKKEITQIAELFIDKLRERMRDIDITLSKEAMRHLVNYAYKPGEGARYVRTAVEEIIETPLAKYLIRHNKTKNMRIDMKKGKIVVT